MVMWDGHSITECRMVAVQSANGFTSKGQLRTFYGQCGVESLSSQVLTAAVEFIS